MWKHPRMSYPNCPYSEKLSVAEINAQIHKVLDLGVNLNPGAGPVPVRRGITSVRVSTLGPILAALAILSFHCAHNSAQGLGGDHGEPWNIDFPMDPARREVRHAVGEGMQTRGERERETSASSDEQKKGGWRPPPDLRPPTRGKWKGGQLYLPYLQGAQLLLHIGTWSPGRRHLRLANVGRSALGLRIDRLPACLARFFLCK
jgi:hypothetical protein